MAILFYGCTYDYCEALIFVNSHSRIARRLNPICYMAICSSGVQINLYYGRSGPYSKPGIWNVRVVGSSSRTRSPQFTSFLPRIIPRFSATIHLRGLHCEYQPFSQTGAFWQQLQLARTRGLERLGCPASLLRTTFGLQFQQATRQYNVSH